MEQTINNGDYQPDELDDACITECGDEERIAVDFNEETGFVKNITIESDGDGSMGDVQAGIEFIYHMREHLVDVSVATVYCIAVYALVLWIKKKLS
jgi:hypothetical protein